MNHLHSHLPLEKYRPDIDGLRAIAILSVVAYHAFPRWIIGGFIGVDIFFVISGFLISTIIFERLDRGTFSFWDFYVRRIKRIFPALLLVLVACYVFGWFVLLADEYKQLGKHIAAGAGFISNIALIREAGYFASSSENKPLLHLWSLGIEEQFYIFWPLILWLAWKKKLNLLTITLVAALISFYLNIRGIGKDAVATFYSPQTRFWELLSGSLLAWATLYKKEFFSPIRLKLDRWAASIVYREPQAPDGKTLSNVLSLCGLLLLIYGFFSINTKLQFPGKWALVPVLGATLIIAAGPAAWINRTLLSNRLMVWFGLISYCLYLWHWPLLSFARILEGGVPSRGIRISVVAFSILLAWLTHWFVEKPIRFGKYGKAKTWLLLVLMAMVGMTGYETYRRDGIESRLGKSIQFISGYKLCTESELTGEVCKLGNQKSNKLIIAFGDSHLLHLTAQLESQLGKDYAIDLVHSASCFMGEKVRFEVYSDKAECERKIRYLESLRGSKAVAVITAQRWHGYGIQTRDQIEAPIRDRLNVFGIDAVKVIILGSTANISFDCERAKIRPIQRMKNCDQQEQLKPMNRNFMEVTRDMKLPEKFHFIYPYEYICPDDVCIFSKDGLSNYFDDSHLTFSGSEKIVGEIKKIVER